MLPFLVWLIIISPSVTGVEYRLDPIWASHESRRDAAVFKATYGYDDYWREIKSIINEVSLTARLLDSDPLSVDLLALTDNDFVWSVELWSEMTEGLPWSYREDMSKAVSMRHAQQIQFRSLFRHEKILRLSKSSSKELELNILMLAIVSLAMNLPSMIARINRKTSPT